MERMVCILKHSIPALLILTLAASLVSCGKSSVPESERETVPLVFESPSIVHAQESKASVDGINFPPRPSAYPLGIWIVRGGTFQEQMTPFRNMKSELNVGADDEIHWNYYIYDGTQQYDVIYVLKGKAADVYAYHPWRSSVSDITAVPFVSGQDDWMWAEPLHLSSADTDTDDPISRPLRFHHAMTCIEVNIRCVYQGNVYLTSMTLTDKCDSPRLSSGGTMNAATGELSCNPPVSSIRISPNTFVSHQSAGTTFYIMMPSVGSEDNPLDLGNKPMELSFVFNGVDAETKFTLPNVMGGEELVSFKRGYKYKYKLVLDNKMDFQPIGVEKNWGTAYVDFEL